MSLRRRDLAGQRFFKLIVLEHAGYRQYSKGRESQWKCRCDCGNEPIVPQRNLVGGNTKSCGCLIGQHKRTHGATVGGKCTPEFRIWDSMRRRCSDPDNAAYADYGGRGISVCERWQLFENFLADMGPRPSPDHSIDRYPDNDGNYEPSNCRWATRVEQSNNRRSSRFVEFNGHRKTMAEWEREAGLKPGALFRRLRDGWPMSEALSPKLRKGRERYAQKFSHDGFTLTAAEWAEKLGISLGAMRQRLEDGLPPEKVFHPGPLPSARFAPGANGRTRHAQANREESA